MPRRKQPPPDFDARAVTPREELVLHMFRQLSAYQQREWLDELTALIEANAISTKKLLRGKNLRPTSNETVRAAYKDVPPHIVKRNGKKKRPGRPDDAPMDDYPEPGGEK